MMVTLTFLALLGSVGAVFVPPYAFKAMVHPKEDTTKCLWATDVAPGSKVVLHTCDGTKPNGWWAVPPNQNGFIQLWDNELCVSGGPKKEVDYNPTDGTAAQLVPCSGSWPSPYDSVASYKWRFNIITGGLGTFSNAITPNGQFCLDNENGGSCNGNKIQVWTCYDGNPNQQWVTST